MKKRFFQLTAILLAVLFLQGGGIPCSATEAHTVENAAPEVSDLGIENGSLNLDCKSAILMEATTGAVLYAQNAEQALPPASVTKIMTLLLIMEAVDAGTVHLDDVVSVSANAASMGGSQVYLKEGEQMTLEDLLKSVVIASANDAAVALAEYVGGSVDAFVAKMNQKAKTLGMSATNFENVTGLDDTVENHLTSAKDIALMSRALIANPTVLQYSSLWMDSIRDGAFGLKNTNRLVRFYRGCTGLKTGSTSAAGFCVSATAERNGFSLICVIMGAESRDVRNAEATALLDWGFANFALYTAEAGKTAPIRVTGGNSSFCNGTYPAFSIVLPKADIGEVKQTIELPDTLPAPIRTGDPIGSILFECRGQLLAKIEITAQDQVNRINLFEIFGRLLAKFLLI